MCTLDNMRNIRYEKMPCTRHTPSNIIFPFILPSIVQSLSLRSSFPILVRVRSVRVLGAMQSFMGGRRFCFVNIHLVMDLPNDFLTFFGGYLTLILVPNAVGFVQNYLRMSKHLLFSRFWTIFGFTFTQVYLGSFLISFELPMLRYSNFKQSSIHSSISLSIDLSKIHSGF